jgi:hypothetical protein
MDTSESSCDRMALFQDGAYSLSVFLKSKGFEDPQWRSPTTPLIPTSFEARWHSPRTKREVTVFLVGRAGNSTTDTIGATIARLPYRSQGDIISVRRLLERLSLPDETPSRLKLSAYPGTYLEKLLASLEFLERVLRREAAPYLSGANWDPTLYEEWI